MLNIIFYSYDAKLKHKIHQIKLSYTMSDYKLLPQVQVS